MTIEAANRRFSGGPRSGPSWEVHNNAACACGFCMCVREFKFGPLPRPFVGKFCKKMTQRDKKRIEKAKDDPSTAMVIKKTNKDGKIRVFLGRIIISTTC